MSLEHELHSLAHELAWPQTPDVTSRVLAAIEQEQAPRRPLLRRRTALAIGLAVIVATVAALAVPQARTAILRALGLGSVRIEIVDELPPLAPRTDLSLLGTPATAAEARRRFPEALQPDADVLGAPDEIRLSDDPAQISYAWLDPSGVRLLVSVIAGRFVGSSFVKALGPDSTLEDLTVDGRRAMWITGSAHGFGIEGPGGVDFEELRLSANALLVEDEEATIRVEGDLTRDEAIRVVRALR